MNDQPVASQPQQPLESAESRGMLVIGIILGLLTALLVGVAVYLGLNPIAIGPSVRVVRDLLIIVMALELVVIGVAVIVFIIQAARLVNLVNNELQPLITATSDTINTVRGTAAFLSKNLADPVIQANSVLRGIGKVASDVDTIRTAAGIIATAVSASSPTSTRSEPASSPSADDSAVAGGTGPESPGRSSATQRKRKKQSDDAKPKKGGKKRHG